MATPTTRTSPGRDRRRRGAGAYLETTWLWPRRFWSCGPSFSFVLADPWGQQAGCARTAGAGGALQHKLFGDKGDGEIALLMFEGDQADVAALAGIAAHQVAALLAGEDDGSFLGRVCKITPTEVTSIVPARAGSVAGASVGGGVGARACHAFPACVAYRGGLPYGATDLRGQRRRLARGIRVERLWVRAAHGRWRPG